MKVEGLATVQSEFGGVTISRDMFEEKKNATSYNYSKEFPATLRDLVARVRSTHQTASMFHSNQYNDDFFPTDWRFQVRLPADGGQTWSAA